MKTIFQFLLILFNSINCFSQVLFQKEFSLPNGCTSESICQTSDSSIYSAGIAKNWVVNDRGIFVVKCDKEGRRLWSNVYNTTDYSEFGINIIPANDNGIYIANVPVTGSFGAISVIKLDSSGNVIWRKMYNNINSISVQNMSVSSDYGFVLTGSVSPSLDSFIILADSAGNVLVKKRHRVLNSYYGHSITSIRRTFDNGFILCGSVAYTPLKYLILLIKTDSTGLYKWAYTYGSGGAFDVIQTENNNYVLTATDQDSNSINKSIVIRTDSVGSILWDKEYNCSSRQMSASKVLETSNKDLLFFGRINTWSNADAFLLRTDQNGNELSANFYSAPQGNLSGLGIIKDYDEQFVFSSTVSNSGQVSMNLTRTDSMGFNECNHHYFNTTFVEGRQKTVAYASTQNLSLSYSQATLLKTVAGSDSDPCTITGKNEVESINNLSLYPVPVKDFLFFRYKDYASEISYKIFNSMAQKLLVGKQNSNEAIDVSTIAPGIYYLKCEVHGQSTFRKFIKN